MGTGRAASKFIADLKFAHSHQVNLITSHSYSRASSFRKSLNLNCKITSHSDIVFAKNIDAVYIATHSNLHVNHIRLALAMKVPILCEKPIALNLEDAQAVYRMADVKDVTLIEGIWNLFLPTTQMALQKFRKVQGGVSLVATFGRRFEPKLHQRLFSPKISGGALYDLGIYPIALSVAAFGRADRILAEVERRKDGLITGINLDLKFPFGNRAMIQSSISKALENSATFEFEGQQVSLTPEFISSKHLMVTTDSKQTIFDFTNELPGIGLWKEAKEIQNEMNVKSKEYMNFRGISLETHRILSSISALEGDRK